MALSADAGLAYEAGEDIVNSVPLGAVQVFQGGALSQASGYAKPLSGTDTAFLGFAHRGVDNSAGSAGDLSVDVRAKGRVKLSVTSVVTTTQTGTLVYATADDTFTLSSTSALAIGRVHRVTQAGEAIVAFESSSLRSVDTSEI